MGPVIGGYSPYVAALAVKGDSAGGYLQLWGVDPVATLHAVPLLKSKERQMLSGLAQDLLGVVEKGGEAGDRWFAAALTAAMDRKTTVGRLMVETTREILEDARGDVGEIELRHASSISMGECRLCGIRDELTGILTFPGANERYHVCPHCQTTITSLFRLLGGEWDRPVTARLTVR
jgi:hypothetical protein